MKLYLITACILASATSAFASMMTCENPCCMSECIDTETTSKRWVSTDTLQWIETKEPIVLEEPPKKDKKPKRVQIIPTPVVKRRACTDSKVYDYFFFNAHAQGGNYGGAYVSGFQMNDAQGMVIRCPDPIVQTGKKKKKRGSTSTTSVLDGYWLNVPSGHYVYDTTFSQSCELVCTDCPPAVPEPATGLLFGTSLLGLTWLGRKRVR